jgi:hypothetical protein
VAELRRLGQVTDDDEAEALRDYFDTVRDLDVEVNLVAVRSVGEGRSSASRAAIASATPAGRRVVRAGALIRPAGVQ